VKTSNATSADGATVNNATKKEIETATAKPTPLPVIPDRIPKELRELKQWVCWRYARRKGRWTKEPVDARTNRLAKSTDAETWTKFDTVLLRCQRQRDKYAGAGFVFSEEGPFAGIDLDNCRNPATGELQLWATEILQKFNSYSEISPSHTGVKIYVRDGSRHTG
jgi:primase-polymerase (primpol)-like protein